MSAYSQRAKLICIRWLSICACGLPIRVSAKADFLGGSSWDALFNGGLDTKLPERLWSSPMVNADVRSPWLELEVRMFEVKGLGPQAPVR